MATQDEDDFDDGHVGDTKGCIRTLDQPDGRRMLIGDIVEEESENDIRIKRAPKLGHYDSRWDW